jgi:hypothetical protein
MTEVRTELLEPKTYRNDDLDMHMEKRANAIRNMWMGYAFFLACLGGVAFSWFAAHDLIGTFVAGFISLVALGIAVWGTYSYYKKGTYGYELFQGRIRIRFKDPDYFVPPAIMEEFLHPMIEAFRSHLPEPPERIIDGTLVIQGTRPKDPLKRIPHERMIGITKPLKRLSYVYGPYALHYNGLGHEFRLQLCEYIVPNRDEEGKIAWMKENGIRVA